jgi:hypothetical protein
LPDHPCYVRVLRVLREIRDGISDLSNNEGPVSAAILEVIDIDFIKQQAELNAFGWDNCKTLVGAVVDIIRRIQSPNRDAETQALWVTVGSNMLAADADKRPLMLCKALEFLLNRVNVLRIDAANAR